MDNVGSKKNKKASELFGDMREATEEERDYVEKQISLSSKEFCGLSFFQPEKNIVINTGTLKPGDGAHEIHGSTIN
ncbi:hypothetical protein [Enterococcus rotai]|uniref:hypothetical protein n=1 Tax=Enterococcus rotai TaxID=118060 RepID=UPI0035C73617